MNWSLAGSTDNSGYTHSGAEPGKPGLEEKKSSEQKALGGTVALSIPTGLSIGISFVNSLSDATHLEIKKPSNQ